MELFNFVVGLPSNFRQYRKVTKLYSVLDEEYHAIRVYAERFVRATWRPDASDRKHLEDLLEKISHKISTLNYLMFILKPDRYFLAFVRNRLQSIQDNQADMHRRLGTLYRSLLVNDSQQDININKAVRKLSDPFPGDRFAA